MRAATPTALLRTRRRIRRPVKALTCLTVAVGMAVAGCGGDSDRAAAPGDAVVTTSTPAQTSDSTPAATATRPAGTASLRPVAAGPARLLFAGSAGLWSVKLDGTGLKRLSTRTSFDDVAVSPDGRQLAFASDGLWVAEIDGTGPRRIDKDTLGEPVFSPNGRTIAMVRADGPGLNIFAIDVDGTKLRQLTRRSQAIFSFHPNGTRLVASNIRDLETVPVGGGPAKRLLTAEGIVLDPSYSPDARSLVFAVDSGSSDSDLYRADAGGENQRRLTTTADAFAPAWSPDGRRIAFHRILADEREVWVVDADGTGLRRLGDTHGERPAFSPDGAHVAYLDGGNLRVMRADGTGSTPVSRGGVRYFAFVPASS